MKRIAVAFLLVLLVCIPAIGLASEPPVLADAQLVQELLPDYTLERGVMSGEDRMLLLMRRADGKPVFVGAVWEKDAWRLTVSTPLPEGTILGVENFTHSLGIPNTQGEGYSYFTVSLAPNGDGTWGVNYMYPPGEGGMEFSLGQYWMTDMYSQWGFVFGEHPWADITTIDWTSLPATYEEAVAQVEQEGWAVVHNPDPQDRLHLRASPSRNAASYGKYYNGTRVRVLKRTGEWAKVQIGPCEGWMMAKYLAFGTAMNQVDFAGFTMLVLGEEAPLYAHYPDSEPCGTLTKQQSYQRSLYVVGVVSDTWYHIWLPYTDEFVYVRQNALWGGNG